MVKQPHSPGPARQHISPANPLRQGQCAVWLDRSPKIPCPDDLEPLDAASRAANDKLATPYLQARHARAHALLRRSLSQVAGRSPGDWLIVAGDNGRPELARDQGGIDFNLSHSGRYVACALVRDARVGIDVETTERRIDHENLLGHVTSPPERDWLAGFDPVQARKNFLRIWVLKEAYAKAVGEGLGLPFERITLMPGPRGGVVCDLRAVDDRPRDWRFAQYEIGEDGLLAVAVRGERPGDTAVDFEIAGGAELLRPPV